MTRLHQKISGRAVPVAAHGRELGAHNQPRVRGAADQGILAGARHRVEEQGGGQGRGALLPRRLLRSCWTHCPLPAGRPAVQL